MGSCPNTDIDPTYQYQYNNTQNIKFLPVDTNLSSSDKKISLMEKKQVCNHCHTISLPKTQAPE